jgi:hypothetical protein
MKQISLLFLALMLVSTVFAQIPTAFASIINPYELPPLSANTPTWALGLYADPINWDKLQADFLAAHADEEEGMEKEEEGHEDAWYRCYKKLSRVALAYRQPDGTLRKPLVSDLRAQAEREINEATKAAEGLAERAPGWTSVGPKETFFPIGTQVNDAEGQVAKPWQANIYSFTIAPSNPNILYCGTEPGFVFKSIDKGLNWTSVGDNFKLGAYAIAIESIEVHPTDPNTVYVGTVEGFVYKSIDGGTSWALLTVFPQIGPVVDIAINPANPQIVHLAADAGLYRSINGGATWTNVFGARCYDLEYQPNDPNTLFALISDVQTGVGRVFSVLKSTNIGATFTFTSWSVSETDESGGRLTVTPANPNYVYAILLSAQGPIMMKSTDAATTWVRSAKGTGGAFFLSSEAFPMGNGQGFYDLGLAASHTNAEHVIVGTTSSFKSIDGGLTFFPLGGYGGIYDIHADMQEVICKGSDTWLLTDGGVNYSPNFFTAQPETRMKGIDASDYWGLGHSWQSDAFVGGRYHNGNGLVYGNWGNQKSLYVGGAEEFTGYSLMGPGPRLAVSYDTRAFAAPEQINQPLIRRFFDANPAENVGGIIGNHDIATHVNYYNTHWSHGSVPQKTTNGSNFLFEPNIPQEARHIIQGRVNPDIMYAGLRQQGLARTTNAWATYQTLPFPGTTPINWPVVVINPLNDNEIYLLNAIVPNQADNEGIWRSTNGGTTWTKWSSIELDDAIVADIEFIPSATGGGLYAATGHAQGQAQSGKVWYRAVGSTTWQDIAENLPKQFYSIEMDPWYRGGKLRLAGNKGVYERDFVEVPSVQAMPAVDKRNGTCLRDTFYFADHSIYTGNATFQWTFSPAASFVSSATAQNPKVVFGTAGNYDVTLAVTVPGQPTSSRTINAMVNVPSVGCPVNNLDIIAQSVTNVRYAPNQSQLLWTNAHDIIGLIPPGGTMTKQYYLSLDQTLSANDILLISQYFIMSSGLSANIDLYSYLPASVPSGNYYIIMRVDSDDKFAEVNEANNIAVSTSTINVNRGTGCVPDTEAPIFDACPSNLTIDVNPSTGLGQSFWTEPNFRDHCTPRVAVARTGFPGQQLPVGVHIVRFTGVDQAGNTRICSFSITVGNNTCGIDNTPPVLQNCPINITVSPSSPTGGVVTWVAPSANDNCPGTPSIVSNFNNGQEFPFGLTTVTFTATDAAGNTATCSYNITVSQPGPSTCPGNFVINSGFEDGAQYWTSSGSLTVTTTDPFAGVRASEQCNNTQQRVWQTISSDLVPGSTYTLNARVKSTGGATGLLFLKYMDTNYTPLLQEFQSVSSGTYNLYSVSRVAPAGTARVEVGLLRNDGPGCLVLDEVCLSTQSCVNDIVPPTFSTSCPANIVAVVPGTSGPIIWQPAIATDHCPGPITTTSTKIPFDVFPLGVTTVIYTATDAAGNSATCSFTVTLTQSGNPCAPDVTAPVLTACPANITATTTGTNTTAVVTWTAPTATDNCPGAVTVTSTQSSGQVFAVGATTVTYTARDAANNTRTCSFVVTVQQNNPGTCTNNQLLNPGCEPGQAGWASAAGPYNPTSTEARTGTGAIQLCASNTDRVWQFKTQTTPATLTFSCWAKVTGGSAGFAYVKYLSSNFTVLGQQFIGINGTAYTQVSATLATPAGTAWVEAGVGRNAGVTGCVIFDDACLTDGANPPNPCAPDVTPPVLSACPPNQNLTTTGTTTTATWTPPTATDACPGAVTVIGNLNPGQTFVVGNTTVIYTARDVANNNSTCSFTITVTQQGNPCAPDVTAPVLSACPANITATTTGSNTTAMVTWTAPTATDNCSGAVTVTSTQSSGQAFAVGATTVTYTARDAANNTRTCSFVVTVQQSNPGTCANNQLLNPGCEPGQAGWASAAGPYNPTSTDARTGTGAIELCASNTDRVWQFKAQTTPATLTFSCWAKVTGGSAGFAYVKYLSSSFTVLGQQFIGINSTSYTQVSATLAAPAGTAWVEAGVGRNAGATGCVIFDDACLTDGANPPNPCAPDVTPPVLSACPASQSLTTTGTSATAVFVVPTATDACPGAVTITGTAASGQAFGLGTNTVTFTARDAANNTTTCTFTVTVTSISGPRADLRTTAVTPSATSVATGEVLNFTFQLENIGTAAATANYVIKSYLSLDNLLSTDDIQDGVIPTGNTPIGSIPVTGALTVPPSTPPGDYFIILSVDADNQVVESNEFNNATSTSVRVRVASGGNQPNCPAVSDFPWHEWIASVKVGALANTSSKSSYTNYINPVFTAVRGAVTALELTAGYSYVTYDEHFRVWIDFNRDNIWQSSEQVFEGIATRPPDGTPTKLLTGNFMVPASALTGQTKMRVMMRRGAFPDACLNVPFGEVEDYLVNIVQTLQSSGGRVVELEPFDDVVIYPNPAISAAMIDLSTLKSTPVEVEVYNAFGKLQLTGTSSGTVFDLDLKDWSAGVYHVHLKADGMRGRVMKLVVVQE